MSVCCEKRSSDANIRLPNSDTEHCSCCSRKRTGYAADNFAGRNGAARTVSARHGRRAESDGRGKERLSYRPRFDGRDDGDWRAGMGRATVVWNGRQQSAASRHVGGVHHEFRLVDRDRPFGNHAVGYSVFVSRAVSVRVCPLGGSHDHYCDYYCGRVSHYSPGTRMESLLADSVSEISAICGRCSARP